MSIESSTLLDETGKKIIIALQENVRLSYAELGRRIGLSSAATAKRLKRMEETGIISGYRVNLNREILGLPILAIIWMSCEAAKYEAFLNALKDFENVVECHHVAGGDAFILKALAHSMEELEDLVEKLLDYGVPKTSVVFSSPVMGRSLPVWD